MKVSPGQKVIQVSKEYNNELYSIVNVDAINRALFELDGNAFKLYSYINKNKNGYQFALSSKDVCMSCSITKPTYLKCVRTLIDLGYLVEDDNGIWQFYEMPRENDVLVVRVNNSNEVIESNTCG